LQPLSGWQIFFSVIGLALASWGIVHFIFRHPSRVLQTLGLWTFSRKTVFFIYLALLRGSLLAAFIVSIAAKPRFRGRGSICPYRVSYRRHGRAGVQGFYPGFIEAGGKKGAIILASLFHAAYKCSLFMTFPMHGGIDIRLIGLTTFWRVGAGQMREVSGSAPASVAAHAFFDMIVYGEFPVRRGGSGRKT